MKRCVKAAICAAVLLAIIPTEGYASCASEYATCSSNFSKCKASTRAGRFITVHTSIWSCGAAGYGAAAATGSNVAGAATGIVCGYVWVYLQKWVQGSYSNVCARQHFNCVQRVRSRCRGA